jgi:hypothetical protein
MSTTSARRFSSAVAGSKLLWTGSFVTLTWCCDAATLRLLGSSVVPTPAGRYFTLHLRRRGLVPWERSCIARGTRTVNCLFVLD